MTKAITTISCKLSNANPVSSWMGERLTLPGAVEFSSIFFFSSVSVPALSLDERKGNQTEYNMP